MNLGGDDMRSVRLHGLGAELKAGDFALKLPEIAVDVEDSSAQKIAENGGKRAAFREIVKLSFEHVFDVLVVGGDDVIEDVDMNGAGERLCYKMSVPVAEIVVL